MKDRVYVLLDVIDGKTNDVVKTLVGKAGVVVADALEHTSGVMLVIEAGGRKELAALTVRAVTSVDNMTHGLSLLPVQTEDDLMTALTRLKHGNRNPNI